MRYNNIDERVLETKRKISSKAFYILLWGMLAILLYRQLYLGQEFSDYGDFFILWVAASAYVALGGALTGINPFGGRRYKFWLVPGVMSITILCLGLFRGTVGSFQEGALVLITSFVSSAATLYILYRLYLYWEKKNLEKF